MNLSALLAAPRAYIDPNTGGMLFQLLAVFFALFSGILFFNITEAAFKTLHLMWNLLLLIFTIGTACAWKARQSASDAESEDV